MTNELDLFYPYHSSQSVIELRAERDCQVTSWPVYSKPLLLDYEILFLASSLR